MDAVAVNNSLQSQKMRNIIMIICLWGKQKKKKKKRKAKPYGKICFAGGDLIDREEAS